MTYYGQPAIKAPVWTWEVPAYFFAGGVAGMAAVIAAVAAIAGDAPTVARNARWIAAAGAIISPILLISDLGRPARFLNMLRVFKLQSPMSVGAWTLVVFSMAVSASLLLTAVGSGVALAADLVAALTGLILATYTGVLIGVTAVPVWIRHFRLLPLHFGATSLGAAASFVDLMSGGAAAATEASSALNATALGAAAIVTVIAIAIYLKRDPVSQPLVSGTSGLLARLGDLCSGPLALLLRLAALAWPPARILAAWLAIAGSLLSRYGWIAAGRRSAADPKWSLE